MDAGKRVLGLEVHITVSGVLHDNEMEKVKHAVPKAIRAVMESVVSAKVESVDFHVYREVVDVAEAEAAE